MKMDEESSLFLQKIKNLEMQLELKDKELKIIKEELSSIRNSSNLISEKNSLHYCDKLVNAYVQTSEMVVCCKCFQNKFSSDSETQTYEADFYQFESKGSTEDWILPEGSSETLTDLVTQTAEVAVSQSDYIYDDNKNMYYSISTGYYYDSNTGIFIDSQTGMKYLYCPETQSYKFISEEANSKESDSLKKRKKISKKQKKAKVQKLLKNVKMENMDGDNIEEFDSDISVENNLIKSPCEDGEILDTSSGEDSSDTEEVLDDDVSKQWPPCIRLIVLESEKLQIGSLLLITCTGSMIGRDQNNDLYIPDISVSKSHADIKFNSDERCYVITDLGSQNGTYLNDFRLSEAKQISQSYQLNHGDNLRIGKCKLLLHIHEGTETCNECEPGQVQAELSIKNPMEKYKVLTKEEKEKKRRRELKQIKKKFGLENMNYEEDKSSNIETKGYEDLTKQRQKTKGSDNPYQKDDEPSSVDKSLSVDNKGYKLLQKMGWSEGEGLGKSSSGIKEPITIAAQTDKTGLGASPTNVSTTNDSRNKEKWTKIQQRYQQLFQTTNN